MAGFQKDSDQLHSLRQHPLTSTALTHKRGVGGAQGLQTYCSHGEWRGFSKTHILHGVFQTTHRLSSKPAHGLRQRGRWGAPRPNCKHNARRVGWKKFICCQASLGRGGGVAWWMAGFQKDSDQLKTSLSHYHRPHRRHCHLHLHVHLLRHHQHVYVSMHECMYVHAMDVI